MMKFSSMTTDNTTPQPVITPALPDPQGHHAMEQGVCVGYYTKEPMQSAYADGVKAEQERCLKIAYEACAPYGKPGECCWVTIKSNVSNTK
jgi:hypothetical protein